LDEVVATLLTRKTAPKPESAESGVFRSIF
jgi:hypothetical protein